MTEAYHRYGHLDGNSGNGSVEEREVTIHDRLAGRSESGGCWWRRDRVKDEEKVEAWRTDIIIRNHAIQGR